MAPTCWILQHRARFPSLCCHSSSWCHAVSDSVHSCCGLASVGGSRPRAPASAVTCRRGRTVTSEAASAKCRSTCCEAVRLSASGWYYAVQHVRPGRPFWPRCAHSPQLWPQPRVTPLIRGFHSWRERSSPPTVRRLWPQCGGYAGHFHESPPSVQRRDVFTPGAAHFVISARGCSVPVRGAAALTVCVIATYQIVYCVTVVATSEAGGLAGFGDGSGEA